ncbi:tetratricopeptide repeat protein, partial [Parasphingorhabdus sp.]|uniref:tetratricopeptide repeat protein n=2 Tax=Parasphingorhabdus sp. TaxID=2709688 RepID=UPI0032EDCE28
MRFSKAVAILTIAFNTCLLALASTPAAAQSDADVQRVGDPDYDMTLGLAALDSGRYGEAILAFQRVLAVQPDNARAQAELARAYAMAGDVDTARAEFETVRGNPSIPDPVRNRIDGVVRQLDKAIAGGASEITGYFDVEGGYD